MKKTKMIFTAAFALLLASCCDTADVRDIKGGYHYKTSGQVEISDNGKSTIEQLGQETGMLEVVSLHDDDNVLITFSQSGGEVYNTKATADGNTLHFDPFHRTLTIRTTTDNTIGIDDHLGILDSIGSYPTVQTEVFDLTVSGRAEIYDNTLIFYYQYDGRSQSTGKTLRGSDIQMLAKKN